MLPFIIAAILGVGVLAFASSEAERFDSNEDFNIGLFGPSGIGKTTLIAAMIEEFKLFSRDAERQNSLYLKLQASDQVTSQKLSTRINDLKSGINRGFFRTDTLAGTAEHEVFKLAFEMKDGFKKDFALHDFPGGWVHDPEKLSTLGVENWNVCIVPVDAGIIMECYERRYEQKVRTNLCLEQVYEFVVDWLAKRNDKPGLFILAPVKCETYFDKPAVFLLSSDKSQLLFNKVKEYYGEIINAVKEKKNIFACYMPVNTVGCCYLKKPTWTPEGDFVGEYAISPERGKQKWSPFGPVQIMFQICQFLKDCFEEAKGNLDPSPRIEAFCKAVETLDRLEKERNAESRYERAIML